MTSPYLIVDVFAEGPLEGNALAVFPLPGAVPTDRMQRIAREMNLSETTFVTAIAEDGYDVKIFTPANEMPFAGHPTLGTAWVLRHLGALSASTVTQRSAAGSTPVAWDGVRMWLTRGGTVGPTLAESATEQIATAIGASAADIGFDAAEIGGSGAHLMPAVSDAGVEQVMLPLRSPQAVAALQPAGSFGPYDGVYCFAPLRPGRVLARFFAPGFGIAEDPATGSAAAGLGLYLGARSGDLSFEIEQGAQVGRPSLLTVEAAPGRARVGGTVHAVASGTLHL